VVISQALEIFPWDITELRRRKEMFESPDNLCLQCSVQSFQSGAGISPEPQEGSMFSIPFCRYPSLQRSFSRSIGTMHVPSAIISFLMLGASFCNRCCFCVTAPFCNLPHPNSMRLRVLNVLVKDKVNLVVVLSYSLFLRC